jgi:hypothetical protein
MKIYINEIFVKFKKYSLYWQVIFFFNSIGKEDFKNKVFPEKV